MRTTGWADGVQAAESGSKDEDDDEATTSEGRNGEARVPEILS